MSDNNPTSSRFQYHLRPSGRVLIINSLKSIQSTIIFSCITLFFLVIEASFFTDKLLPGGGEPIAWYVPFLFFPIGLSLIIGLLLWNLCGKEEITDETDRITIKAHIFGIGRTKRYNRSEVSNLRLFILDGDDYKHSYHSDPKNLLRKSIAFDYGKKRVLFGINIEIMDAKELVYFLKEERVFPS